MKYLHVKGELNPDMAEKLLDFLNENQEERLIIFFASSGGESSVQRALASAINDHAGRITLVATGEMFSAGFRLFFSVNCSRIVLDGAFGLTHYSMVSNVSVAADGKPNCYLDEQWVKELKENKHKEEELLVSLGANKKEMQRLRAGKDVCFSAKRMREFLEHQNCKH